MDASPLILDEEELRVVAGLVEKEATTPDQYPMTLNGIRLACNQASNRDPVVDYSEATVEQALRRLADRALAKMVHRPGDRVVKYRHSLDTALEISGGPLSVLAVLLLRGTQTPGELRQRTSRYGNLGTLGDVEEALSALTDHDPPLVERLERRPGQKEVRYRHLLGSPSEGADDVGAEPAAPVPPSAGMSLAQLADELETLRRRVDRLFVELGIDDVAVDDDASSAD